VRVPPSPPPLPTVEARRAVPLVPAWDFLWRNRHITAPTLAVPPAFAIAGEVLAHAPAAAWPTAAGSTIGAAVLCGMAHHKWDRPIERWFARATAAGAAAWLTATAFAGFGSVEAAGLAAGCLAWGIPWWWHKRPRKQRATVIAEWARWWQYYAPVWGVAGSRAEDVTAAGVITTLHVRLWPGHQDVTDIEGILSKIETALRGKVAHRMTRCEVDRADPSLVLVHLKHANPHNVEYGWDPEQAPTTVNGDMPVGKDEHGNWVKVPCMALNWFVIGALGGGKSNQLSVMLASLTRCPDALVWGIDLAKRGKAFRPWKDAVDWVATTVEEARAMLRAALAEIADRNLHGYTGEESITPTVEVPAIFIVIDEAHNVLSDMAGDGECQRLMAEIASQCRSAAVRVIIATQYGALHESVGTEQIRGNLMNRVCFKVADASHGQFALEDYAKLNAARLENKGEFYYRLEGAQSSAPCRSPHMTHELVRQIAARNARVPRPRLCLYAREHQALYDTRYDRCPAAYRPAHLDPTVPPSPALPQETPMHPQVHVPETPEQIAQRIEDDVSAVPDLAAPPPVDPAYLVDAVTGKKRAWALLLSQAPPGGIAPAALTTGSGLSRSWTHQQLAALIDLGVITKPADGRYLPVPGQDVWAGLERIKEARDRLARELVGV